MLTVPIKDMVKNWIEIDNIVWANEMIKELTGEKPQIASDEEMFCIGFGLLMLAIKERL